MTIGIIGARTRDTTVSAADYRAHWRPDGMSVSIRRKGRIYPIVNIKTHP